MTNSSSVALPGSFRPAITDVEILGPVSPDTQISVTLVLRRRAPLDESLVAGPGTVTTEEFAQRYGADGGDLVRVAEVVTSAGLSITGIHVGARQLIVRGPASILTEIFGTQLSLSRGHGGVDATVEFHTRSGELRVPAELDGVVTAVLGLDDRTQSRAYFRLHADPAAAQSFTPDQLGSLYGFPDGTDGKGQTIAMIELGGGFKPADISAYFAGLKIAAPTVTAVGVGGGTNTPTGDPGSADGEVMLDIEIAGALAPGADQVVYFAPNTDQGFLNAVTTAVHATPTPAVVSISWGQSEDQWTAQARTAMDQAFADAAALGVSVCAASGDNGSSDNQTDGAQHADFPASSPHVLGCGGTHLEANSSSITSETVWNTPGGGATGGGVSTAFPVPAYQSAAGVPARAGGGTGRGVPDVAGNADPATGYQILVDGQRTVAGGTSAVAPLWAALLARLAQGAGRKLGLVHTQLYQGVRAGTAQAGFRDITTGSNGAYQAAPGWDACTGLGTPDGKALLQAFTNPAH